MRAVPLFFAALVLSAPAAAEPTKDAARAREIAQAQAALTDPATGAMMSRMIGALAKTLMNMPVGELEAAIEGRIPTAADRKRTVRDSVGSPQEAARIERDLAASGPQMDAMRKGLAGALPGMIAAAGEIEEAMAAASAGLPHEDDRPR